MEFKHTKKYCYSISDNLDVKDLVGIKAINLASLIANNVNVPSGFVISGKAFDDFLLENDLVEFIVELLNKIEGPTDKKIQEYAHKIREKIFLSSIPTALRVEVQKVYEDLSALGDAYVVVRQSAITPELDEANFDRNLSGYLNVRGSQMLLDKIVDVWADLFAEEAIRYRAEISYEGNLSQPVLVQKMIAPEVSGVLYNFDLQDYNTNKATIIANLGLSSKGSLPVQGNNLADNNDQNQLQKLESDYYLVTKVRSQVLAKINNSQKFMWVRSAQDPDKPFTQVKISRVWSEKEKITNVQIQSLITTLLLIENITTERLEIEWILESGVIYIVEVREIDTTALQQLAKVAWPHDISSDQQTNEKIILNQPQTPSEVTETLPTISNEINSVKSPTVLEILQKDESDIVMPETTRSEKAQSLMSMLPEVRTVTEIFLAPNRPASEVKVFLNNLDGMGVFKISEIIKTIASESEIVNLERSKALQKKVCEYLALYLVAISPKPVIIQLEKELGLEAQLQVLSQLKSLYGHKNFWISQPAVDSLSQVEEIKKELAANGFRRSGTLKIFQLIKQPLLLSAIDQIQEASLDGIILDPDSIYQSMIGFNTEIVNSKLNYPAENLQVFKKYLFEMITNKAKLKTYTIWQINSQELFSTLEEMFLEVGINGIIYSWQDLLDFKQTLVEKENQILTQGLKKIKERLKKN